VRYRPRRNRRTRPGPGGLQVGGVERGGIQVRVVQAALRASWRREDSRRPRCLRNRSAATAGGTGSMCRTMSTRPGRTGSAPARRADLAGSRSPPGGRVVVVDADRTGTDLNGVRPPGQHPTSLGGGGVGVVAKPAEQSHRSSPPQRCGVDDGAGRASRPVVRAGRVQAAGHDRRRLWPAQESGGDFAGGQGADRLGGPVQVWPGRAGRVPRWLPCGATVRAAMRGRRGTRTWTARPPQGRMRQGRRLGVDAVSDGGQVDPLGADRIWTGASRLLSQRPNPATMPFCSPRLRSPNATVEAATRAVVPSGPRSISPPPVNALAGSRSGAGSGAVAAGPGSGGDPGRGRVDRPVGWDEPVRGAAVPHRVQQPRVQTDAVAAPDREHEREPGDRHGADDEPQRWHRLGEGVQAA